MLWSLALLVAVLIQWCGGDNLLLVQSVWRHGDRTPTAICKGDKNTEDKWLRFGGFGQLTPRGMAQHVALGELIYRRYAIDQQFFSKKYSSKEIYVRSTDLNRTLISAASNMIGMYYLRNNMNAGDEYPINDRWPADFVPVPIHTIYDLTDYVANPDVRCWRQDWLWEQAEKTPEMISLRKEAKEFVDTISELCNETTDLVGNMWRWRDTFNIERIYNLTLPISDEQFQTMTHYNNIVEDRENGINISDYDGINFRIEIGKIRGGGLLWEMIRHNDLKIHCLKDENRNSAECDWMKNLKYYAYSAHDTTVAAMLAVVGAKEEVVSKNGYPEYSSAVVMELWNTTKNGICIKVLFHRNFSTEFEDITKWANDCDGYECCPFMRFRNASKPFYPSNDEASLCADVTSKSTYFDPDDEQYKTTVPPVTTANPTTTTAPATVTTGRSTRLFTASSTFSLICLLELSRILSTYI